MPILETVTLTIGGAIAKNLLDTWVGDGWKSLVAEDLFDLARDSFLERLTAASDAKQISAVAKQIVQQMKPLLENEMRGLRDDERLHLIEEAALTLKQATIDGRMIVQQRLDAERLFNYLMEQRSIASKQLTDTEEQLYKRILRESSLQIVKIATNLSGFENEFAGQTLFSLDELLENLQRLLTEPSRKAKVFEKAYCEVISDRLDRMEQFGLPRLDTLTNRQRLSVAYITLNVETEYSKKDERKLQKSDLWDYSSKLSGSINRLLRLSRRLVIRGQAGSGKSTLLQWLAVRSTQHDFPEELKSWNECVPFFIRLREFVDKGFPAPEIFPHSHARTIVGTMPQGWVHELLDNGRALVLVDGVDEMPQSQRSAMLEELKQLIKSYPYARYIISSRPAAIKEEEWPEWQSWLENTGFITTTLQNMLPEQVDNFIEQWHTALSKGLQDRHEREEVSRLPVTLKHQLRNRPDLRKLTVNPLLCAMVCAVHRDNRENLPSERLRLYQQCIEMLLHRRDPGRKITQDNEYPNLSESQREWLAQDLASWLQRSDQSDAPIEDVDSHLNGRLQRINVVGENGQRLRKWFVERANLLREPVVGRIDFTHRTFQEYLAAKAMVEDAAFAELLSRCRDDRWRETIILAMGQARPHERKKFLQDLLKKGDSLKTSRNRHYLYLLAVACLETCVEIEPDIRKLVLEKAVTLLPPQNDDEVSLIAKAGTPVVELLGPNPEFSDEEVARSINTLAQIGSDSALTMLTRYSPVQGYFVQRAIGQAWNSFDRTLYASQVLKHTHKLHATNLNTWSGFEYLTHLTELTIDQLKMSDLSPLAALTNLETLNLSGSQISSLTPLTSLPKLKNLFLSGIQISDLSSLLDLTNLERLSITYIHTKDFSPLAYLTKLKYLNLSKTQFGDLSLLTSMSNLERLDVSGTQIIDSFPLAMFSTLKFLSIANTSIQDISHLKNLRNLEAVDISETRIDNISPLENLIKIRRLNLSGTKITDLSPIRDLINLTTLFLLDLHTNDLSALQNLANLEEIYINGNKCTDLSPLLSIKNLRRLILNKNQQSNLTSLKLSENLSIERTNIAGVRLG